MSVEASHDVRLLAAVCVDTNVPARQGVHPVQQHLRSVISLEASDAIRPGMRSWGRGGSRKPKRRRNELEFGLLVCIRRGLMAEI